LRDREGHGEKGEVLKRMGTPKREGEKRGILNAVEKEKRKWSTPTAQGKQSEKYRDPEEVWSK